MSNLIDMSVEAALELEELRQDIRQDVPALRDFFGLLRSPAPDAFETGERGICMLGDVRSYTLLKESLGEVAPRIKVKDYRDFRDAIEQYLNELEKGVAAKNPDKIIEAKRFCLTLNAGFTARQMSEIYSRREASDSRYITDEFT
jgi:hypothetical protein